MADITKPIIIKSPIIHTCGSNCYIIHPETDSSQVMVSETTRLDEQLETINRAIAGSSAIRFTNNIAERNTLTNILPGDRVWVYDAQEDPAVGTAIPAMYIWTPDKVWKRVGEAAAINIKDFIEEGSGIVAENNKIALEQARYEIGEFYHFRHPTLRPGFEVCYGGLIEDAAEKYPEAWQYFQTSEGELLLKSEAEWQAMTVATWHTRADDGGQFGWNGIGGAPFFVQDLEAGTLRMPDLRGMFAEAAGFDSLGVGDAKGDGIRNISGSFVLDPTVVSSTGCFYNYPETFSNEKPVLNNAGIANYSWQVHFSVSRIAPTANANRPRSYGVLPCAYLGRENII